MRKRIVVNIASMNIRSLLRVRLEAELAIRRRQFDPQLRTVAGAQRNGEECQLLTCRRIGSGQQFETLAVIVT
jgi:hypothetical protein